MNTPSKKRVHCDGVMGTVGGREREGFKGRRGVGEEGRLISGVSGDGGRTRSGVGTHDGIKLSREFGFF